MTRLSCQLRLLLRAEPDPARLMEGLNRELCEAGTGERYVTLLLILLDARTNELAVVSAGHMAPLVRRAGGAVEELGAGESGLVLGAFPEARYRAARSAIGPGDVVVLYTDGVSDARDPQNRSFTTTGLVRAVAEAPPGARGVGEAVLQAVRAHAGAQPQFDDITLLCFGPG